MCLNICSLPMVWEVVEHLGGGDFLEEMGREKGEEALKLYSLDPFPVLSLLPDW